MAGSRNSEFQAGYRLAIKNSHKSSIESSEPAPQTDPILAAQFQAGFRLAIQNARSSAKETLSTRFTAYITLLLDETLKNFDQSLHLDKSASIDSSKPTSKAALSKPALAESSTCAETADSKNSSDPITGTNAASHISIPGSTHVSTVAAKIILFNSYPKPDVARRLRSFPKLREVVFREAVFREDAEDLDFTKVVNVEAILATSRGALAASKCSCCREGRGPFTECYVLEGMFQGSCTNCHYDSTPNQRKTRCDFRIKRADKSLQKRKRGSMSETQEVHAGASETTFKHDSEIGGASKKKSKAKGLFANAGPVSGIPSENFPVDGRASDKVAKAKFQVTDEQTEAIEFKQRLSNFPQKAERQKIQGSDNRERYFAGKRWGFSSSPEHRQHMIQGSELPPNF